MRSTGYMIGVYRDRRRGWQDVEAQFATLKAAKILADAIVADEEDRAIVAKVMHRATKQTLYVVAAGPFDSICPRSNPTC